MDGVDQVEHMQELVQESAAVIVGLSSNYRSLEFDLIEMSFVQVLEG